MFSINLMLEISTLVSSISEVNSTLTRKQKETTSYTGISHLTFLFENKKFSQINLFFNSNGQFYSLRW